MRSRRSKGARADAPQRQPARAQMVRLQQPATLRRRNERVSIDSKHGSDGGDVRLGALSQRLRRIVHDAQHLDVRAVVWIALGVPRSPFPGRASATRGDVVASARRAAGPCLGDDLMPAVFVFARYLASPSLQDDDAGAMRRGRFPIHKPAKYSCSAAARDLLGRSRVNDAIEAKVRRQERLIRYHTQGPQVVTTRFHE